jgi:DNA polymerase I-like protein with 3'-5' exonuclease and polymerase domains
MGSDQSGIELRCLASYMSKWDKGEYAKIILDGDIHTTNMEALGLTDRGIAKTWAYGFLYGAGVEKLGNIVGKGRKEGSRLKTKFLNALPALKGLQDDVKEQAEQGTVNGLDGRVIPVRHAYASLNTLLQSCGAVLAKRWVVIFHQLCKKKGYTHGVEFQQCAWVHDEIQVLVKQGTGDVFGALAQEAMRLTGDYYNFGIQLDAEYNIGRSWADTH